MFLEKVKHFNDLSPKLREELTKKVLSFGKTVRYRFNISNPNPDPTFHDGKILWPNVYTLDPTVFNITDPHEDRKGPEISKSKRIAIVEEVDKDGLPSRFRKVRVHARMQGILRLDPEEGNLDFYICMFLELHPKLTGGQFSNKAVQQVFTRVDEAKAATEKREVRTARVKALNAAQQMSDEERIQFADAMMWDSTEQPAILGNMIEELAETDPSFFNDLVEGKGIEYQALVQNALNRGIITFDPASFGFTWGSNNQPITVLSPMGEKNHIQKMSEWMQTAGDKATAVYKKLKELVKDKPVTV